MGHIKYQDIYGHTVTKEYDNSVIVIDLYCKNIVKILEINSLSQLQTLFLHGNKITSIEVLEHLTQLQKLFLHGNKITSIEGLEHLTRLQELQLSENQITSIKGLDHLTQLQILSLHGNKITSIEGLEHLTQLQILCLSHNEIKKIKGLEHLTQLQYLYLSSNQITSIEELDHLTQLQTLYLDNNQITDIPFTIMNLHNLTYFYYDLNVQIDPIIKRFLNRNRLKPNKLTIYNDSQNVHDTSINRSISESIYKILNTNINFDAVLHDILNDLILTDLTKDSLIEYSNMEDLHSILNVTFKEVLQSVWSIIKNHKDSDQIKHILNEEMKDSLCKCFTGRLSRLVNSLNGFDQRVTIKISDSNEISNIIILIRNKYDDVNIQKREIKKELKEREYSDNIISEWLSYL